MMSNEASDSDAAQIRERLEAIFAPWSPGGGGFDPAVIADFYCNDDDMLAYDTLMPSTSVMRGWPTFAAHWQAAIGAMRAFSCALEHVDAIAVHGDVAWSALILKVDAVAPDGSAIDARQHVTLIWERQGDSWRIRHEHLSGPVRDLARDINRPGSGA